MYRERIARRIGALAACWFVAAVSVFASEAVAQSAPTAEQKAQIAPTGVLRAAVVKLPFLAKQDATTQELKGVAPDLGAALAAHLGLPYQALTFDTQNAGLAALRSGAADITFLAPTPERAALIDFGPAFMEMEMSLIVLPGSPMASHADADQPGRRIVVYERTTVEEMLRRKMTRATVLTVPIFGYKRAFELLKAGEADAFADLRDGLISYQQDFPDARIVPGHFGSNALAIGYPKDRPAAAGLVRDFTTAAIASGQVTRSLAKAGVNGVTVPGAP
jgi:polar amino acid transport system substrate-binding protein